MYINLIQNPPIDKVIIKKEPKLAKIKRSLGAIKLLLTYCGLEAFQKKNTNKLYIWCKSSPVTGTCRNETRHQHNKQRGTSTRWLPHQIDNHNNQFRNYSFIIYPTKMKNNMKNTPCPDKFIFNQKTKQHKWASSDDKNNLCYSWPCTKSSLLVNLRLTFRHKFINGCCISSGNGHLAYRNQTTKGKRQVDWLDLQCEFTDCLTKTTCLAIAFQHESTLHVYI